MSRDLKAFSSNLHIRLSLIVTLLPENLFPVCEINKCVFVHKRFNAETDFCISISTIDFAIDPAFKVW